VNYRHAFHAGNFADCMKHAVLVWLLRRLAAKEKPFSVLDTHAGAGLYDLSAPEASQTGEWHSGIGRLLRNTPPALMEYLDVVRAAQQQSPRPPAEIWPTPPASEALSREDGECKPALRFYPGSPAIARAMLREHDRLICCEQQPEAFACLRRHFARDQAVSVHCRDGVAALTALLPPAERRGLVLIDPPYEAQDEFSTVAAGLLRANRKFATGVLAAWYPIKGRAQVRACHDAIRQSGMTDVVAAELLLREPLDASRLNGCGLVVVNPPFRFEAEVAEILAALASSLGDTRGSAASHIIRLATE
jgi:23S rRNA (adenine2030-N6)-methyltransferase